LQGAEKWVRIPTRTAYSDLEKKVFVLILSGWEKQVTLPRQGLLFEKHVQLVERRYGE